jgi:hypothetical protein
MDNFNSQANSSGDPSQTNRATNENGYESDSSGFIFATQPDINPNNLSPSCSYYTATPSIDRFELSNPHNHPDPYDQLSSSDITLNENFRLKWNEPVISYSNSTISTYWVDREQYKESSYETDILQTRESDKESNANPFFPSYQLSSDTNLTFPGTTQNTRNDWEQNYGLSRSSTFVYEPDLQPSNYQPYSGLNDDDTIPSTQPTNIRYGAYLASINEYSNSQQDFHEKKTD